MRRAVSIAILGALIGAAYGALIGTTFPILALLTQPLSTDVLLAAAAMELYVASYGLLFGASIGLPYGIVTAIAVTLARRVMPRWAGQLAAVTVLFIGLVFLPDHLSGDAPMYSSADMALDQAVQLLILRAIPAAIAAAVSWRFARSSRPATRAIPVA
ncbi:MAG: hypothetical protein AUH85_02480 [Chloroflexi bacterium 13_1_40CM_4_68_4]|nr:MAG: hypothetical protein AUH85_02480 [Chloroflexi bacterium 13_1_40CM_4_68_4]